MPLPPYSSYKIKGKPLFQWAREGKLDEIKIPMRQTKINSAEMLSLSEVSGKKLLNAIKQKISLIKGDFRQKEILKQWQKMLPELCSSSKMVTFWIAKIKISCSSGTYIRSIAHYLGKELKTGASFAGIETTRTKVGNFDIKNSLRI